jgi:hypothetical protein
VWPLFASCSMVRGVHLRYGVGSRYAGSNPGGLFIINQVPQSTTVTSSHSYHTLNQGPSSANRNIGPYRTSGGSYQSSSIPQVPKPSPYFFPHGDLARSACLPGHPRRSHSHEISAFTIPACRSSCFEHRRMSRSAYRSLRPCSARELTDQTQNQQVP